MKLRPTRRKDEAAPDAQPAGPAAAASAAPAAPGPSPAAQPAPAAATGARSARAPSPRGLRAPRLGLPLAALALLDAAWAAYMVGTGRLVGLVTLPWAAFFLALSAALPMTPGNAPPEAARLRLVGVKLAVLVATLVLAAFEVLALLAGLGLVFSFSDVAALLVRVFPVIVAALLAVAAVGRVAAGRWGHALPPRRSRRAAAGLLALPAGGVGVLLLLATLPRTHVAVPLAQAPFIAGAAALAALLAVGAGALPSLAEAGEWLAPAGRQNPRALAKATFGLAAAGLALAVAGAGLWAALGPGPGAIPLAAGLVLTMLAGYPAGVARWAPMLADEDPDVALRRWRLASRVSLGIAAVGVALLGTALMLSLVAATAGTARGPGALAVRAAPALLGAALALQALLALRAPKHTIPGSLGALRRAAAWNLGLAALLLALFGVLLASGLAQLPSGGVPAGLALFAAAGLASAGHSLLRVVLGPSELARRRQEERRAKAPKRQLDTRERIQRSMHLAYAAGLVGTMVMVGLVFAFGLGVVKTPARSPLPGPAILLLGLLLVAPLLGFAGWRVLQAKKVEVEMRAREATEYRRRLSQQEVTHLTIMGASISAAVVLFVLAMLIQFGVLRALGPVKLAPKFSTDFIVFSILVGLGPIGFSRARRAARTQAIDEKFPEFLRDLAESKRAGMTLTQAVVTASKGSYGELTEDIRKMAAQIEWGISFGEALERFARRVKTPLIERSVSLIVQASEAGGNVVDILHAAAEDARELQLLQRERKTAMSIYVMIIYIAFFVFLSVIAVLDAQFLPEVAKAIGGAKGVAIGPVKFGKIDTDAFKQVFFHAAIIQALGGGLVAGVMESGRPESGLRHAFIMVIIGYIAFRFVIGG